MVADSSKARIASTHLKHIMEYAVIRGVSKRQMLAALPYSSDHIYSESAIVTPDEFYTVLQVIDKQLKDDLAGIRCGRFLNMRALGFLIPEYLKLAESLKADSSFSSRVKIAALNLAGPELPDLKTVADSFNITTRTLQRRLQSENNSFRGLLDEMKRRISDMLLQHNRYSVADISFVLGYSEPSAFIHSFKKWHGIPPKKFRESFGY